MLDILLASANFMALDPKQLRKRRPYPPLATLYAAAHLERLGWRVGLFDAMLSSSVSEFEAALDRAGARYVVLCEDSFNFLSKMCLTRMREAAQQMARAARARGAIVIAAGPDVTDHPEHYLRHGVSFAVAGEAEHACAELIELCERQDPRAASVPGVVVVAPDGGKGLHRSRPRVPEREPDRFPLPAWHLVDIERYRREWREAHGFFSINLVSTRGCPFHCNWCAKPVWGQRYAMHSPARVAEEMALVKRAIGPDHVWFADDIFGLRPAWVAEFAREVASRDARIPFTIQSRVDLMTPESVAGLAAAGCAEVWLGVESGSQKILDAMDKGITVAQVAAARQRLRDAGVRACFFLQFGYPGETLADIHRTVQLVREQLPDDIGISVSYPLPGTAFFERIRSQLGVKTNWRDSGDLAMMFRGTYDSRFYRRLHDLLHEDLLVRQRLARQPDDTGVAARLAELAVAWRELDASEEAHRNARPTALPAVPAAVAPDLSQLAN